MSLPTSLRYLFVLVLVSLAASYSLAQASYTSQIRGVVTDQSGASIPNATVTITNDATGIASTAKTNDHGEFLLTGLRPDQYTVKAQAPGFQGNENKGVVLAVSQQTTLNFTLKPASVVESVTVTQAPPLLDTDSAAIGTDVTNQYVRDIPLYGRSMFGLVFLAGGVTETSGSGQRQLPRRDQLCFQWSTQCHRRDYARRQSHQRAGTGRGWQFQRLLPAFSRNRSGIQSSKQQLFSRVRKQRRHRS